MTTWLHNYIKEKLDGNYADLLPLIQEYIYNIYIYISNKSRYLGISGVVARTLSIFQFLCLRIILDLKQWIECFTLQSAKGRVAGKTRWSWRFSRIWICSTVWRMRCHFVFPRYLQFSQLKPAMAKTRSNEQCAGHGDRTEEERKGRNPQQQRQEANTC